MRSFASWGDVSMSAVWTFCAILDGAKVQTPDVDTSPQLSKYRIRHIQDVVGTLLYYARSVYPALLATLSQITSRQSTTNEEVATMIKQLLDYIAAHPNSGIRYVASDMIINLHSDASYLSEPKAKAEQEATSG